MPNPSVPVCEHEWVGYKGGERRCARCGLRKPPLVREDGDYTVDFSMPYATGASLEPPSPNPPRGE